MHINDVVLQNFRNFKHKTFKFDEVTIIYGPNASGKSSILEAINLIAMGRSQRAEYDKELISFEHDHARVTLHLQDGNHKTELEKKAKPAKLEVFVSKSELSENTARKKFLLNGVSKQLNTFASTLKCSLFTPTDIEIITDGPSVRRKFLDQMLSLTSKEYRTALTNLIKVIKNRNKILEKIRDENRGHDELSFWNNLLVTESRIIHTSRKSFFSFIQELLNIKGQLLDPTCASLMASYKISEVTNERLAEYEQREIASKSTLIGPTRDDFSVLLNSHDISNYGSRGQQRVAVLALKICEIEYIEHASPNQTRPILLLDDIFSELDEKHRKQILEIVKLQQTIITTADKHYLKELGSNIPTIELV